MSQPNTEGQQSLQLSQLAISSEEISSQRALALNSGVFSLRSTSHVNEFGQAAFGGVLKDEGLHEVIAVVAIDEVVHDWVDAAV